MEILQQIKQYVSGNLSYADGVELYNKVGTNNALKLVFDLGDDDYSRDKLRSTFQEMLDQLEPLEKQPVVIDATQHSTTSFLATYSTAKKKGSINVENLPEHLKTEYYKLSPLIREMASLHAKLLLLPTKEERFNTAQKIVELSKRRRHIFNRIDYYEEHQREHPSYVQKVLALETVPIMPTYIEAQYQLKLLRSQRTKLEKNPDRHKDLAFVVTKIEFYKKIKRNDETVI